MIQQVSFRLHMNDHTVLKKMLSDEDLTFQSLVSAAVEAYLRGDPAILKVLKDYKDLNTIPKEVRNQYSLSHRERQAVLDELAAAPDVTEMPPDLLRIARQIKP